LKTHLLCLVFVEGKDIMNSKNRVNPKYARRREVGIRREKLGKLL